MPTKLQIMDVPRKFSPKLGGWSSFFFWKTQNFMMKREWIVHCSERYSCKFQNFRSIVRAECLANRVFTAAHPTRPNYRSAPPPPSQVKELEGRKGVILKEALGSAMKFCAIFPLSWQYIFEIKMHFWSWKLCLHVYAPRVLDNIWFISYRSWHCFQKLNTHFKH